MTLTACLLNGLMSYLHGFENKDSCENRLCYFLSSVKIMSFAKGAKQNSELFL